MEETYELVKKYLSNQLPPGERERFERRLAAETAFRQEAVEAARLYEAIQQAGDRRLTELLRTLDPQKPNENNPENANHEKTIPLPPRETKIRTMIATTRFRYVAAVVAGLLIITIPLWMLNRQGEALPVAPSELYSDNFRLPPAPEARDNAIEPWREAYFAGEYAEAITYLEQLLADTTYRRRSEAFLYLGLCRLALDQPEAALQAFDQVGADSFNYEEARWYSALAFLKREQIDEAKKRLEEMAAQPNHPHGEEARRLLERL